VFLKIVRIDDAEILFAAIGDLVTAGGWGGESRDDEGAEPDDQAH